VVQACPEENVGVPTLRHAAATDCGVRELVAFDDRDLANVIAQDTRRDEAGKTRADDDRAGRPRSGRYRGADVLVLLDCILHLISARCSASV
jgi:hypothetical protein